MEFSKEIGKKLIQFLTRIELRSKEQDKSTIGGDGIEEEFGIVFSNRINQYFLYILVPLLTLAILDLYLQSLTFPTQVYGLLVDFSGAVVIARGLFRGKHGINVEAHGGGLTGAGPNNQADFSAKTGEISSTVDGIIGALLLTTGFMIQILSLL